MKTIMIVEDDEDINDGLVKLFSYNLLNGAPAKIVSFRDSCDAKKYFKENVGKIDLVITDSGHTNGGIGGGAELIKIICSCEHNLSEDKKTKIIVITGEIAGFRRINPEMNIYAALAKPFLMTELLEIVGKELGLVITRKARCKTPTLSPK